MQVSVVFGVVHIETGIATQAFTIGNILGKKLRPTAGGAGVVTGIIVKGQSQSVGLKTTQTQKIEYALAQLGGRRRAVSSS